MGHVVCKTAANKKPYCMYVTCTRNKRLSQNFYSPNRQRTGEEIEAQTVFCDQDLPEFLEEPGHLGSMLVTCL